MSQCYSMEPGQECRSDCESTPELPTGRIHEGALDRNIDCGVEAGHWDITIHVRLQEKFLPSIAHTQLWWLVIGVINFCTRMGRCLYGLITNSPSQNRS